MSKKTFTTAKGRADYPYISTPDTKFDDKGHYKVNLCLSKEDAEPVKKLVQETILEGIKALKKDSPNIAIKQAPLPFHDELDKETNEPTGNVIIKFKSQYKPAVFDSKGNMMTNSNICGGSILKVGGLSSFYHTKMLGAGVSIRLSAVQIIEYVEGSQGAEKFGFVEEEGFTLSEDVSTSETDSAAAAEEVAPAPAKPKVVQAIKPAQQVKPVETQESVEEPKAVKTASDADSLASEIADLINKGA